MLSNAPNVSADRIRAIVVDDEPLARLRLCTLLGDHHDFAVVAECADGSEVPDVVRRTHPDVVFLDIQMAETNGIDVAHALDAPDAPAIVFVTAYDAHALRAFELHAVDYLLKPFDEERFARTLDRIRSRRAGSVAQQAHARLLSLLRDLSRGSAVAGVPAVRPTLLHVGDVTVDLRARAVRRGETPVSLRPKEFELLVALMRRAGDVVGRRELLHDVWGYNDSVASRTVDTHVAELRRKLGHTGGEPGHIATVARTGYRLEV